MTKDEIMALAEKVGLTGLSLVDVGYLGRFAELVAAAERKACVKACKEQRLLLAEDEAKFGGLGIAMCVDAIKARGKK